MKTNVSIAIIIIVLAVLGGAIFLFASHLSGTDIRVFSIIPAGVVPSTVQTTIGTITINAILPSAPATVPIYHGYYGLGGNISLHTPNWTHVKNSVPNASEVPLLAQQALAPYGGIPPDAVVYWIGKSGGKGMNLTTGEVLAFYLTSTNIVYDRQINGMPVLGQIIRLDFGENGELLYLFKRWRTLTQIDEVPVISASEAIVKLQRGEVLNHYQEPVDVTIDNIQLGYYAAYPDREEETLEPVWIFSGLTNHGSGLSFYVDARESGSSLHFANFTASPTSGTAPLTVSFKDVSTGPVQVWYWDFGDGSSNWTQNPVHTYLKEGMYTVQLLVIDDKRDNTCKKTNYIVVGKKAIVMHIDTMLDELKNTLNLMNLAKGNKNSLMQKLENAQKKNGDALKFIDKNKEKQANNMLNADDNLMNAFVNEVNAQTGKSISTVDAAKLKDGATEIREFIRKAIETQI